MMETTEDAIKFAKFYCKLYGIKYKSIKNNPLKAGAAHIQKRLIEVEESPNLITYLSTVFHEVMHIRCADEHIFPLYHVKVYGMKSQQEYQRALPKVRQQAYRAEVHVDKMAKVEMQAYFPTLKYAGSYIKYPAQTKKIMIAYWV